jgi:homoserine O-acetyltransferase
MSATPGPMSGRNAILRRTMIEMVKADPDYNNGNYTKQPQSLKYANAFYGLATSGGTLAYQATASTPTQVDAIVNARLAAAPPADANDFIYQWQSSADYDPTSGLSKIQAAVLAINAADDERNPPELGIMESALKQVKNAKLYLIPASTATRGHATNANATFWNKQFHEWLLTVPRLTH